MAYSGGKDSDVILQLAKESGIEYRAIYKNTTIDPPGTIKHAKMMGAEEIKPKKSFFTLIAENGYPNMFARFCCKYLKEYKVLDKAIVGIRKSESVKRANRYNEPTQCRYYGSKKEHVEQIMLILDWTDEDVENFITDRGIKCAPVYYDENGKFHVERRLGCIACPLASKRKRVEAFKKYPRMVKQYLRYGQIYLNNHPNTKTAKTYEDVYEWFVRDVYYTSKEWDKVVNGIFGKPNFNEFLEKEFAIDLTL